MFGWFCGSQRKFDYQNQITHRINVNRLGMLPSDPAGQRVLGMFFYTNIQDGSPADPWTLHQEHEVPPRGHGLHRRKLPARAQGRLGQENRGADARPRGGVRMNGPIWVRRAIEARWCRAKSSTRQ
ncbi:hypothetical protein MLD38_007405 [Melastoma candidum]|uniref:Uncharacterized protein n=1 Tax=Melastoma candidum TaxID=119954 RepID=A0ACB9RR00_9MYRT|nr:hypothetical protein MLD38_007405 [Melastoma candidum]